MNKGVSVRLDKGRRKLLGFALLYGCSRIARPQADNEVDESHIKAAFLYKFTNYVDWPESALGGANAPFVIGVLGSAAVLEALLQLTAGRKVHERLVVVRKVQPGEDLLKLQVLFVGHLETLGAVAGRPLLVVTEADDGMPHGSMINFLMVDRHVRFEIELSNVEKAGLRMSSRLLSVAQKIYQDEAR